MDVSVDTTINTDSAILLALMIIIAGVVIILVSRMVKKA